LLLLAHIDVVDARRADWERDPFTLIEENGYLYGRGTADDKAMAAVFLDLMVRLKRERNFRPKRDLIMALTCGEETSNRVNGVDYLLQNRRELIDAAFAINEGPVGCYLRGQAAGLAGAGRREDPSGVHTHGHQSRSPIPAATPRARWRRMRSIAWPSPHRRSRSCPVADSAVKVKIIKRRSGSKAPELTDEVMGPVRKVAAKLWPGVPIAPSMTAAVPGRTQPDPKPSRGPATGNGSRGPT
jgi:hypothetical protein